MLPNKQLSNYTLKMEAVDTSRTLYPENYNLKLKDHFESEPTFCMNPHSGMAALCCCKDWRRSSRRRRNPWGKCKCSQWSWYCDSSLQTYRCRQYFSYNCSECQKSGINFHCRRVESIAVKLCFAPWNMVPLSQRSNINTLHKSYISISKTRPHVTWTWFSIIVLTTPC